MPALFLIVDDDSGLLKAVARMLRNEPVEAVFVGDPREALALCKQRRFDVVLSDFMMPNMNGVELLKEVRALLPDATRMLLTAHAESPLIAEAKRDDTVQRVLEKPFRLDRLLAALRVAASLGTMMSSRARLLR